MSSTSMASDFDDDEDLPVEEEEDEEEGAPEFRYSMGMTADQEDRGLSSGRQQPILMMPKRG